MNVVIFLVMIELDNPGADDARGVVLSTHHTIEKADAALRLAYRRRAGVPEHEPRRKVGWRLLASTQRWRPGDAIELIRGEPVRLPIAEGVRP